MNISKVVINDVEIKVDEYETANWLKEDIAKTGLTTFADLKGKKVTITIDGKDVVFTFAE